jgi:hypothetical protein
MADMAVKKPDRTGITDAVYGMIAGESDRRPEANLPK